MRRHTGTLGKIYVLLVLILLYLPILIVVIYSFNESKTSAVWSGFTLDWYGKLFSSDKYIKPLMNSLTVGIISVLGAAVIGTTSAVGAASRAFRTKSMFEGVSLIPIMIPEIILGMALLSVFSFTAFPLGMAAIIMGHITFCIPYVYLVVKARLKDIDRSVIESARDLGASPMRAFMTITVPLLAPAVGGGSLLAFAMSFDDIIISSLLSGTFDMLPVQISSSLKFGLTPELNALFALMVAVILLCLIISRILVRIFRNN